MQCLCRNCGVEYDSLKARGDWAGYCSAKCTHERSRLRGYRKGGTRSEYECLGDDIGNIPTREEKELLKLELSEILSDSSRAKTIKRLLRSRRAF